jgi:Na+-transporting NADH:ubiquinone oxidoreductase subunit A
VHLIRKGLDLPIAGAPEQRIHEAPGLTWVGLLGDDYPGLRARLQVHEGQTVRRGELLFEDRAIPGVRHTAPAAGRVAAIHRGARRALRSVVLQLSEAEQAGDPPASEHAEFEAYAGRDPEAQSGAQVRALLVESGLWTALRTRPFSKVPHPETKPDALFVNAMDTEPLAASPEVVIRERRSEFESGLRLLAKLCEGPTYLCVHADSDFAESLDAPVSVQRFGGPHPAGTAGVHIHLLAPAGRNRTVWSVGYQDAIAIGRLFATGRLCVDRVISVAGPPVRRPRLVRSRIGASVDEHAADELDEGEVRLISGSVLSGKKAMGAVFGYLGRYHLQISALREGRERELFGWVMPGANRFSVIPVFLSRLLRRRAFDFTTATQGSPRAIMPIGLYERVMPMDILPTFLLRALAVGDIEQAEKLGCLELDEEDLALASFVCPGKTDYGPLLRQNLDRIEREG